ncbi:MAG: helix-turn-helix transcriptional regulator [Oscillospiraceae bacterium]|nr:helix-turn-helix transcriptional regulator [Oscillospiraceae bacterium]
MTLGQNIARLRGEKHLSQGELADALDVSRQSISKWETDASVPELEKLVKLSELFGVSLDELVKGEREEKAEANEEKKEYVLIERQPITAQQVGGFVLLGISALIVILLLVLGAGAAGLIFGAPFFICGLICLWCKQHAGLWCGWAVYLCVDAYLRYATGLTWAVVLQTHLWEPSWNYMRLFIGWCQFLVMLAMIFCTLRAYRKFVPKKNCGKLLAVLWAVYAALCFLPSLIRRKLIASVGIQAFFDTYYNSGAGTAVDTLLSYACLAIFCLVLVRTQAWWKVKKEEKKDC